MLDIARVQSMLKEADLDGWLLADFHGRNTIATGLLDLNQMLTRRSFYFIPVEGEPVCLVNSVEPLPFEHLPGELRPYSGYKMMESALVKILSGCNTIAMEYSAQGRNPYIGLVEAGTIELVRDMGLTIAPSADMVSLFLAQLSEAQVAKHHEAARNVMEIMRESHKFIAESLDSGKTIHEYDVVQFIMSQFESRGMVTDHSPICAVDANAGNGHYSPDPASSAEIKKGQLILIDEWGKLDHADGIVADITWMAYSGTESEIPSEYHDIFNVVKSGRDAAYAYLKEHIGKGDVRGADVDDACRNVIVEAGYGKNFGHRTGHSITWETHGAGPNIDNLETEDARILQPGHLFSIEPGIYSDKFGFRSEVNCLITSDGPVITTAPAQDKIVALF